MPRSCASCSTPTRSAELELELQALTPERAAGSADQVHDLLRRPGRPVHRRRWPTGSGATDAAVAARAAGEWLGALAADRRAVEVRVAGEARWIAAEDVGALPGRASAWRHHGACRTRSWRPTRDALGGLLSRYARRHGPFLADGPGARAGDCRVGVVETGLEHLMAAGVLVRGEFRPGGVEREWCDPEVLRLLRRRSLAGCGGRSSRSSRARSAASCRHGRASASSLGGADRLLEVIGQLEGLALPASVLERDILPARVARLRPAAARRAAGGGRGGLGRCRVAGPGRRPGRSCGGRTGSATALPASPAAPAGDGPIAPDGADGVAARRAIAAASWRTAGRLASTARSWRPCCERRRPTARASPPSGSCWTRCGTWSGRAADQRHVPAPARAALAAHRAATGRPAGPGLGATGRVGPPEGAGRWSLVAEAVATAVAVAGGAPPSDTERRHALALRLLDRHGLLTRDGAAAEDVPGGFAAVYPILREMEDRGRVRRGYFVEGLGGAQFALPGALDRLRAGRAAPGDSDGGTFGARDVLLLAATDPANPYGVTLPWPPLGDDGAGPPSRGRPARTSCSSTATRCSTSSAAAGPSRRCRRSRTRRPRALALRALSGWSPTAGCARSRSARIDGVPHRVARRIGTSWRRPASRPGYRGLVFGGSRGA